MPANLPVTLTLLGVGGLVVYASVVDATGGPLGALKSLTIGQPVATAGHAASDPGAADTVNTAQAVAGGLAASAVNGAGPAALALSVALSLIGTKYTYGGTTPTTGFDCSGLTQYCYAKAGVALPRTAAEQYRVGTSVPIQQAQPGDLLFFDGAAAPGHVGLFVSTGIMVDAPHTGSAVRKESIWPTLVGCRRVA